MEYIESNHFLNKIKDLSINEIVYYSENYGSASVPHKIPNHLYLKIYNINRFREYKNRLNLDIFLKKIYDISKKINRNIEIVKYVFLSSINKLREIKNSNTKWIEKVNPYLLTKNVKAKKNYLIWIDNNKNPKKVNTKSFKKYGYIQINGDKNIQYLDSAPEKNFFEKFDAIISNAQRNKINFLLKCPPLGSSMYFEYYSESQGKISKSYIDFAIEYQEKIIMVEVKSEDNDYNEKKTNELLKSYKIYMEKFRFMQIYILLYRFNEDQDSNLIYSHINGEWKERGFRDTFDYFFEEIRLVMYFSNLYSNINYEYHVLSINSILQRFYIP